MDVETLLWFLYFHLENQLKHWALLRGTQTKALFDTQDITKAYSA